MTSCLIFQTQFTNNSSFQNLKNTTRVEIIITINVENRTNIRAKFFLLFFKRIAVSMGY